MKHSKALFIVVLGALFLTGLRSEDHKLVVDHGIVTLAESNLNLFWDADAADGIILGPNTIETEGPESISAKLSGAEGKTLRELEELVQELGARLKLAQQTHDQELRMIGAAKFPSRFGLAGKLDTLKDFSEIRWSPRTPSCQSGRIHWESLDPSTSDLTILPTDSNLLNPTYHNSRTTDLSGYLR